jgi:DNA polymerase-3 subunit alpha
MPPLVMGGTRRSGLPREVEGFEDGYNAAATLARDVRRRSRREAGHRRRPRLEGLRRQDGIHAAAVVITHEPLTEYLPIQRKPEPGADPSDAPIVTQYEMHGVEELGLLKMDFLGLRNLSVIETALDLIEESTGERVPTSTTIPLDDERPSRCCAAGTRSASSSSKAVRCAR